MWEPYLTGGALRPDAISGLDPMMQNRLLGFMQAAPEGLQIYSAYRSPELQAQLYENALAKYGDETAARKWVAPPGKSQHNHGRAVDLQFNGQRLDKAPEEIRNWVAENAARYGLTVPMEWEPWQVELAGARDGTYETAPQQFPTPETRNYLAPPGLMLDARNFLSKRRFG